MNYIYNSSDLHEDHIWFNMDDSNRELFERKLFANYKSLYWFNTERIGYPLDIFHKYYGMWHVKEMNSKIKNINSTERSVNMDRYVLYFGFSEIEKENYSEIIKSESRGLCDMFLLLSNRGFIDITNNMKECADEKSSSFITKFSFIINEFCNKGDCVIIIINGCDGVTVNYFYTALFE